MTRGRRIEIEGTVQGVGFRPWVYRLAAEHGIGGCVRNQAAGVVIDAFGSPSALEAFTRELRRTPPPAARIRALRTAVIPGERPHGFVIDGSAAGSERVISIPPDLATCADCLAEILDPHNRRYRYAFTTCTNCGPRFTVSTDVPYDRGATTLSEFTMCADCQREYDTTSDRRFHAEANACPACGPALMLLDREGRPVDADDPIDEIVRVLLAGGIAAIKGLGGFHLTCDATSAAAVDRLRQRKRRDAKPFAVMVRDLAEAEALALLTAGERSVLSSNERPILLAEPSAARQLAPNVAPDAPLVGLLLPYTPLHHLVVRQAQRPLVMTSGNRSEEPLAHRTDDAVSRLATIADVFLTHDRGIAAPCDDSVVRVIHGQATVLRRARGYVPRSIRVSPGFDEPVLACGALLKSTFCIGVGQSAYLSAHIGDLENLASYDAFVAEVARMERFLDVTPGIVAHDLHPEYASVRYAESREAIKVGVQHHHAHVVSAMAEHGLSGPVIGVAYDGTGYGTDGRAWGGEVLIAWADRFERVSTLRPIRLPGGDAAIREPWRAALALIDDAFDGDLPIDALALLGKVPTREIDVVRQLLAASISAPEAHGAGRYFDSVGALVLARTHSRYEGQLALALNGIAARGERRRYGYTIDRQSPLWTIDLRAMVREIVRDRQAGVAAPVVSARFHNTLVEATAVVVRDAAAAHGKWPVVLTGGCFQNPRLASDLARSLGPDLAVHLHRHVPPGDGGIALGQAIVAAAVVRGSREQERPTCA